MLTLSESKDVATGYVIYRISILQLVILGPIVSSFLEGLISGKLASKIKSTELSFMI